MVSSGAELSAVEWVNFLPAVFENPVHVTEDVATKRMNLGFRFVFHTEAPMELNVLARYVQLLDADCHPQYMVFSYVLFREVVGEGCVGTSSLRKIRRF